LLSAAYVVGILPCSSQSSVRAVFRQNGAIVSPNGLTENAGHEIAGHKNTGHEFARHDKYLTKIDYITLECAFPINF